MLNYMITIILLNKFVINNINKKLNNDLKEYSSKKQCFKQLNKLFNSKIKFAVKLKYFDKDLSYYNNFINKYNLNHKDVINYKTSLNNINKYCNEYKRLKNILNHYKQLNNDLNNFNKCINVLLNIDVKKYNLIDCRTSNLIKLQYGLYKININKYNKFIDYITFINPKFIDIVYYHNDIIQIEDKILLKINLDLHNKIKYLYEYYIDSFININNISNDIYIIIDKSNYYDFLKICNLKYKSLKQYTIDKSIIKYYNTFNKWFIDIKSTKKGINKEKKVYNNINRFYDKINYIKDNDLKIYNFKLLLDKKINFINDKIIDFCYIMFILTKKDFYIFNDKTQTQYDEFTTLSTYLNYTNNKNIKNKGYRLLKLYNELIDAMERVEYFISNNKDYYTDKDELEVYLQPIGVDKGKYTINSKSYLNHDIALKNTSFTDAVCYEMATDYGNLSVGEGNTETEYHNLIKPKVKYEWEK